MHLYITKLSHGPTESAPCHVDAKFRVVMAGSSLPLRRWHDAPESNRSSAPLCYHFCPTTVPVRVGAWCRIAQVLV